MAEIEIQILAQQVQAKLNELQAKAADMRPAYSVIGKTLVDRIRLGFRFSRGPWGKAWTPLKSRNGKPLVDKDRLRKSILPSVDAQGVTVGTNLKVPNGTASLAAVHQFGATILPRPENKRKLLFFKINGATVVAKKVTIPARPFMPLTPAGQLDLPDAWQKGILRNLAAHLGVETPQGVPA